MWAQALLTSSNSILFPHQDPPIHNRLFHSLAFGYAGEYSWVVHALALFSFAPMSFDTTSVFIALHFELDGYFPLFFKDYELD